MIDFGELDAAIGVALAQQGQPDAKYVIVVYSLNDEGFRAVIGSNEFNPGMVAKVISGALEIVRDNEPHFISGEVAGHA